MNTSISIEINGFLPHGNIVRLVDLGIEKLKRHRLDNDTNWFDQEMVLLQSSEIN